MCLHVPYDVYIYGTLLCSFLEDDISIPAAIISIQLEGVERILDALSMSPIHMQFEVY